MMSDHPDILISGRCYTKEQIARDQIVPRIGDLKLFHGLDRAGRYAAQGGHANFGYSGNIQASVFDGRGWRRMRLMSLLGTIVKYATQGDKDSAYANVRLEIRRKENQVLKWDEKRYVFPAETDEENK